MDKFTVYLMRHENRHSSGLYDCTLTKDGQYNSMVLVPEVFLREPFEKDTEVNIYCSPTVRTMQTIYNTYQSLCNSEIPTSFNLEEGLYECVSHDTSHYLQMSEKPKVKGTCNYYFREIELLHTIQELITAEQYNYAKIACNNLVSIMHDSISSYQANKSDHYGSCFEYVDSLLDDIIISLDIYMKTGKWNKSSPGIILSLLKTIETMLDRFDMFACVNTGYSSIVNIDKHFEEYKHESECIEKLEERSNKIVDEMFSNPKYQNSIYVSHRGPVDALLWSIANKLDGNPYDHLKQIVGCRSKFGFYSGIGTEMGTIYKVTVDKKNNKMQCHRLRTKEFDIADYRLKQKKRTRVEKK